MPNPALNIEVLLEPVRLRRFHDIRYTGRVDLLQNVVDHDTAQRGG